jgi:hypothetical protein
MKKIIMISSLVFLFATAGFSQKNLLGIAWEINMPNNDNYLNETSFSGGKIEYRHVLKHKNFSLGAAIDWSSYEQHIPRQTFHSADGNSAVTSDFVAHAYQVPITATAHFYLEKGKHFRPFAGIALGGQYLEQSLYYNVYVSEDNNWGFVARPELGTIITTQSSSTWGILVAAYYSYATNKTDAINSDSFNNFGITLGVLFGQ